MQCPKIKNKQESDSLFDGLCFVKYPKDKLTQEVLEDAHPRINPKVLWFGEREVVKNGETVQMKEACYSNYYINDDEKVNPKDYVGKRMRIAVAIHFPDIFVGEKISLTGKVKEASIYELIEFSQQRLLPQRCVSIVTSGRNQNLDESNVNEESSEDELAQEPEEKVEPVEERKVEPVEERKVVPPKRNRK